MKHRAPLDQDWLVLSRQVFTFFGKKTKTKDQKTPSRSEIRVYSNFKKHWLQKGRVVFAMMPADGSRSFASGSSMVFKQKAEHERLMPRG